MNFDILIQNYKLSKEHADDFLAFIKTHREDVNATLDRLELLFDDWNHSDMKTKSIQELKKKLIAKHKEYKDLIESTNPNNSQSEINKLCRAEKIEILDEILAWIKELEK